MEEEKLYMMLLGCKPPGRNTEQHDVFFCIARQIKDAVPSMLQFWPEAGRKMHLDAWREIKQVGEFDVQLVAKNDESRPGNDPGTKLYFINLGGYKAGEFEEFHYRILLAAINKEAAVHEAKQTSFYKHCGIKGAPSHLDDKYGIDVDDLYEINDILPQAVKENYRIVLTAGSKRKPDTLHLGYMRLETL